MKKFVGFIVAILAAVLITSTTSYAEPFVVFRPTNTVTVDTYEVDLDGTITTVAPTNNNLVLDLETATEGDHVVKARGFQGKWRGKWSVPFPFTAKRPILDGGELVLVPPAVSP